MSRSPGISLFVCLISFGINGQTAPALERVPASQIAGATLTLPDGSAALDAPAGWVWLRMPAADRAGAALHPQAKSETYLAVDPADRSHSFLLAIIQDGSHNVPTAEYMDGVGSGLTRTSPKTGWHISDYGYEKSDIPLPSAYRYHCVATSDAGVAKHRFGYLAGQDVKYHISCSTESVEEPEAFRRFVASFHLLQVKTAS
jgi:hypothetical protein